MAITVDVHEAKNQLPRLLELAHAGQEVILAKAGKPYARLVPLAAPMPRRIPGRLRDRLDTSSFFDPLPDEELNP